jgi:hypothetical protein
LIERLTIYNGGRSLNVHAGTYFLILAALAAQPRHGYGVVQAVEDLSGG